MNLERVLALIGTWRDGATLSKIASALNGAVPERTLRRWLTKWVGEGRLIRHGTLRGAHYFLTGAARGNGGAPVAESVADVSPVLSPSPAVRGELARRFAARNGGGPVAPERQSVTYQRSILDAYHPNEMAYLTESQRMNLSHGVSPDAFATARGLSRDRLGALSWSNGRTPPIVSEPNPAGYGDPALHQPAQRPATPAPAATLSPQWQRFTTDLVVWSRDAQVALGLVPRRHRAALRPQIVAGVVARPDVPSMAGELRRIWNHRDAVSAIVASTQTSGLTCSTVSAVQTALTRLPAAAAVGVPAGARSVPAAAVSSDCRPLCRTEPLVLAGTAYHPAADAVLIEPCLRQIVLTAAVIEDPAEASFFTFAQLLLLLSFATENLSSAVLLANVPLLAAQLQPVSLAGVSSADLRVAVLSWWELGRVDLLAQLWGRPVVPSTR